MKKLTLVCTASLLFAAISSYAQPRKGDWMVGANIANSSAGVGPAATSYFSANLNPSVGYFLSNRIAVGAGVGLSYQRSGKYFNSFSSSIIPFARYYFTKKEGMQPKKLYFFGEVAAGAGVGTSAYFDNGVKNRQIGSILLSNAGVGLAYFILPNVSVEGTFKLNYNQPFNAPPGSRHSVIPSVGIGFQIYLPGKKGKTNIE